MTNNLAYYNPVFYAQEALIQLEKQLGMAARIHRGYDAERKSFGKGETIKIRRPSVFTVGDAPAAAQDLNPDSVDLTLSYWRETKFKLTDRELAFTQEQIINEHIRPQAVILADDIDQKLCALYKDVPWVKDWTGATMVAADIGNVRETMFGNAVPLGDEANMHFMLGGAAENHLTQLSQFSQYQGSGQAGIDTQMRGQLGRRYGFEFFANQNAPTHVSSSVADALGTLDASTVTKGLTSILVNAVTASEVFEAGDTLVIAGNTQRYAITAQATATGGGAVTLTITPPLAQTYSAAAVVTMDIPAAATTKVQNIAFHRNAFALAMAPLSEMGNELGAKIATITDPISGLSLRSRLYYVGNSSEVHVAMDVLYGVKTLDGNLAVRSR